MEMNVRKLSIGESNRNKKKKLIQKEPEDVGKLLNLLNFCLEFI